MRFPPPFYREAGDGVVCIHSSASASAQWRPLLEHPEMVRAVAVYEPALFSLLEGEAPRPEAAKGIRDAAAHAAAAIDAGDPSAAAARFIDYWMGAGTWRQMPESRQQVEQAEPSRVSG
jgi:hypothetical protein